MSDFYHNFLCYPKAVMLLLISVIVIFWVLFFIYKHINNNVYLSEKGNIYYILYSVGLFIWILTNSYFHSKYLIIFPEQFSIIVARISNLSVYIGFICAFLFSCSIREYYIKEKTSRWKFVCLFIVSLYSIIVNIVPGLAIKGITIHSPSNFILIFGFYSYVFFFIFYLVILSTLVNVFFLHKHGINKLNQTRIKYIVSGMIIFMSSTITIQFSMTSLLKDFSLTWLPPTLSISEMLMVGYALITSRFYSGRYVMYIFSSVIITFLLFLEIFKFISYLNIDSTFIVFSYALIVGLLWKKVFNLLRTYVSLIFYSSRFTPVDNIYSLIHEFKVSPNTALEKTAKLLNVPDKQMFLMKNNKDDDVFDNYFSNNRDVLIIEELVDKINRTGDANNLNQLHDEMDKNDMAMVMPMFNTNDNISHLLISSHKSNGRLFSNEEIVALKKVFTEAQYYINADVRLKQSHALAHSIAHEMKNPLGQLQLHLEQIKTYSQYQETQGKLLKEVDDAQSAIKQGKQLIEMILTEVANSSLEQEPMSVSSIQRLVLHAFHQFSFSTELEKSRVHVQIDTDFSIRVNDTLFNFVIFNLLRNAIYYFHDYPDSEVEIKGIIGKQHNRLVVKDTGPGIPPEVKSKVFEDFYSHGKTGGSGLGLSYCMRVMRSFGGSIECYSEPGSYTEFHLVFPALETEMMTPSCLQFVIAEPAPQEKIDNSTGLQRKTALVVDDNKVQRALVRLYLCQLGYDVIEAVNGLKGVESFNQHSVDFVIMDIQMPVMNGFEATERIKICNPEIPVIALTGESGDAERELIQKLMDAHIVKPASRADLLSVLRELNIMSTHSESTNSIVSPAI